MVLACVLMTLALLAFLLIEWPVREHATADSDGHGSRVGSGMTISH